MIVVIDGYNLIFTVPELEKYVGVNRIEPVRDHVITLLSKYKGKKHYDIIVVFDGNRAGTNAPKTQTHSGITVIYSKPGIDADTEIKKITSLCQNPKDVCIVTYDNDIKRHAKKCGCQIIDPKILYKEIVDILSQDKRDKSDEPEYKRKGPSEDDAEYWKDVFKNLPDKDPKPVVKNTVVPKVKKKGKHHHTVDEPPCKYQGPSADETQYWLRVFKGIGNDDDKDKNTLGS